MEKGNHPELLEHEGKIVGVNLSHDYTAGHEHGIRDLRRAFGLDAEELGLEGKKNSIVPEHLYFFAHDTSALFYTRYWDLKNEKDITKRLEGGEMGFSDNPHYGSDKEIIAAWGQGDFGVHVRKKHNAVLENLYDAFQTKNGIITLSAPGMLGGTGLMLLDYRKIPEEDLVAAREADQAGRDLYVRCQEYEAESGIHKLLEEKGKSFMYLGVEHFGENDEARWWLNGYGEQFGWYSTEDLKLWAEDKGPIYEKGLRND